MGSRETPELADRAPGLRGTGFILFPETPVVSEIAAAMDGLAQFFRPAVQNAHAPTPEHG